MNSKLIKIGIILVVVVIILCIIGLIIYNNKTIVKTSNELEMEYSEDIQMQTSDNSIVEKPKIKKVTNEKYFYTVSNYVQYYLDTNENEEKTFIPLKMNVLEGVGIDRYIVYGYIINEDYELVENLYIIVNLDNINGTFSIDTLNQQYSDINDIVIENNNEEIEDNGNNKFKYIQPTDQKLAEQYFNIYKSLMLSDVEKSYDYLDNDYKNKRFHDIEKYKSYIEEIKKDIYTIKIQQYLVNKHENYTEYVCKDQYGNIYIFNEKTVMDYTVKLDTYTIMTDEFIKEYTEGDDHKKVIMNIDKFIQMINNDDFETAYSVLNNTFKENNFGSEETFKKYIKDTYYRYNDIVINDFSNENGTYVYKTTISDKEDMNEEKSMNIIMKLNEGTDFEMSFEIME